MDAAKGIDALSSEQLEDIIECTSLGTATPARLATAECVAFSAEIHKAARFGIAAMLSVWSSDWDDVAAKCVSYAHSREDGEKINAIIDAMEDTMTEELAEAEEVQRAARSTSGGGGAAVRRTDP